MSIIGFGKQVVLALTVFFVSAAVYRPFLGETGVWALAVLLTVWLAGRAYRQDSPSWFLIG